MFPRQENPKLSLHRHRVSKTERRSRDRLLGRLKPTWGALDEHPFWSRLRRAAGKVLLHRTRRAGLERENPRASNRPIGKRRPTPPSIRNLLRGVRRLRPYHCCDPRAQSRTSLRDCRSVACKRHRHGSRWSICKQRNCPCETNHGFTYARIASQIEHPFNPNIPNSIPFGNLLKIRPIQEMAETDVCPPPTIKITKKGLIKKSNLKNS